MGRSHNKQRTIYGCDGLWMATHEETARMGVHKFNNGVQRRKQVEGRKARSRSRSLNIWVYNVCHTIEQNHCLCLRVRLHRAGLRTCCTLVVTMGY